MRRLIVILPLFFILLSAQSTAQVRGAIFGVGAFGGLNYPTLDYPYATGFNYGAQAKFFFMPELALRLRGEAFVLPERSERFSGLGNITLGSQTAWTVGLAGQYYFQVDESITPYALLGATLLFPGSPEITRNGTRLPSNEGYVDQAMLFGAMGGVGLELFIFRRLSLDASLSYTYFFGDRMEAAPTTGRLVGGVPELTGVQNDLNDMAFALTLGVNYYFGKYEEKTVKEDPAPTPVSGAVIESFSSSPAFLVKGGNPSVTLSWTVTGADSAVLVESGKVPAKGSKTLDATKSTSFTLSATGKNGTPVTRTLTIPVKDPVVVKTFTTSPQLVARGENTQVKVQWETAFAESVTISGLGTVPASGYKYITVNDNTTFTLTATGPGGPVTKTSTVAAKDLDNIQKGEAIAIKVEFATGSARIDRSFFPKLDSIARKMQARPTLRLEISGHTDNTGPQRRPNETEEQYDQRHRDINQKLSVERAKSVKDYLVGKKIPADRLEIRGAGEDEPIDDNNSEEGRSRNRRIEFKAL